MAQNYSGKQYELVIAKQDQSVVSVGTATTTNCMASGTNMFYRVDSVGDFDYSGGFTTSEVTRGSRRVYQSEDLIQHYGSGSWTFDFDYLVENEVAIQNLLSLIYAGSTVTTSLTIPANAGFEDLSHGVAGDTDMTAVVLLVAPTAPAGLEDEDKRMHSAVLQELTLSMDSGTDAGRLRASGQFMSGYKPVIEDSGLTGASTTSTYKKSIYDLATLTIGGTACTLQSFEITISNPATRVGFQGSAGEADGYVRGGEISLTGTMTVKYDGAMADKLDTWIAGTDQVLVFEDDANFSFNIPAARLQGHNVDYSSDGMFVEIPFKGTSGANGASNLCVIKMT